MISTLLVGGFDNANQSYFDGRGGKATRHRRVHFDVTKVAAPELGERVFVASGYWDNDEAIDAGDQLWLLSADAESKSVRMRIWAIEATLRADEVFTVDGLDGKEYCDLFWHREAAQFRATGSSCDSPLPQEMLVSDKVDWPINNYEGIFTRDSFVIYLSEEVDGERKEHGYAFTVPDADRVGINLKWILASCFMKSNRFATPYM